MKYRELLHQLHALTDEQLDQDAVFMEPYDEAAAFNVCRVLVLEEDTELSSFEDYDGTDKVLKKGTVVLW